MIEQPQNKNQMTEDQKYQLLEQLEQTLIAKGFHEDDATSVALDLMAANGIEFSEL